MRRYVFSILKIKRNVSHAIKCFIHTMNYLNIQGHVESLCVFNVPFLSTKALDYHILTRHRHLEVPKKSYKCAICNKICKDRKELYSHRLNQHWGNDNIQNIPPVIRDHGNNELLEVYNTNR